MEIADAVPRRKPRRRALTLLLAVTLGPALATARTPTAAWPAPDFQRGVVYSSWDGSYPHAEAQARHLARFKTLGVTWLQVMTFAHQPRVEGPAIKDSGKWPATFLAEARRQGFKILLKPHVFSMQFYDGSKRWRGSIRMTSHADRAAWFAAYERFIVDQARKAAAAGVEMFSIGLEYVEMTRGNDAEWRRIIKAVRAVYPGLLTYSADGNHEMKHVTFWDALDVIGVNAYFKMAETDRADIARLTLGLVPHLAQVELLAEAHRKPVVFTEVGLPSVQGAARRPWAWPAGTETVDARIQADGYETLLRACARSSWCHGMYWWKYYERSEGHSHQHDYSPRGKPAEARLRHWYSRSEK